MVDPDSGAWWRDPGNRVRIHVGDRALIPDALRELHVRRLDDEGTVVVIGIATSAISACSCSSCAAEV